MKKFSVVVIIALLFALMPALGQASYILETDGSPSYNWLSDYNLKFPVGTLSASGRNITFDPHFGYSSASTLVYWDANSYQFGMTDNLTLEIASGGDATIAASGGDISFSNENLSTTGTLSAGDTTVTKVSVSDGDGGFYTYRAEAAADITGTSITIQVNVPSGARILGVQLRVDVALATGELWAAAYETGSTQAIAASQAVAQNTKVNVMFNANAATDIASAETDVAITKQGGGAFTTQGNIRAIVYYQSFTAMGDAS